MSEIKSRYWLKTRRIMLYENFDRKHNEMCFLIKDIHKGHLITRDPFSQPYCLYGCEAIDIFIEPERECLKSNEYVQELQYTGLKDKNGKKIYEGDIVDSKYRYQSVYTRGYFEIKSLEQLHGAYGFIVDTEDSEMYNTPKEKDYEYRPIAVYADSVEVVGNIYENPELLENK